jgi:sugar/nucleoside kinase (ribokinase family)
MLKPPGALDVVGFGALNLDYIAGASRLSAKTMELVQESTARFEWGAEGAVDAATISSAIDQLGPAALEASLGGSAWNTILTLANMRIDLRLGYVGFVGRVEHPGLSFHRRMDSLGIDRRFVGHDPDRPCGTCLSYIEDGERILLTYPGANVELADYLAANFEEVASYLAGTRFIHVTSFLDDHTPRLVFEVLRRAKLLNPRVLITFDPGHAWARAPSADVEGILRLSDYVVVNYREFKALGQYAHGESDQAVAAKLLVRCGAYGTIVVPKRYDVVEVFHGPPQAVQSGRYVQRPLEDEDVKIEDATGAGDTFAAGLLAALAATRLQVELGAYLGMSLARHKIRHKSFQGHAALPDLTRGFLQSADVWDEPDLPGSGVFMAHGPDRQWQIVQHFLEQECGLLVHTVDSSPTGADWVESVSRGLRSGNFAVCVLTPDDAMSVGPGRASQAVINLAGVFQGAFGVRRVALLVEEGCAIFSNMHGVVEFRFRHGHVESTLWQLERMLRREGVLGRPTRQGRPAHNPDGTT